MMVGYEIDFATILWNEIHDRAFGEMINYYFIILFIDCMMMFGYQRYKDSMRENL